MLSKKTTKIKYENKYPWMTQSLRKCIREKNQLSSMVILDPTNEQLELEDLLQINKIYIG